MQDIGRLTADPSLQITSQYDFPPKGGAEVKVTQGPCHIDAFQRPDTQSDEEGGGGGEIVTCQRFPTMRHY